MNRTENAVKLVLLVYVILWLGGSGLVFCVQKVPGSRTARRIGFNNLDSLALVFITFFCQGIIDMNRNRNSATFFSYVCNGKKSKELFASALNGIPISVRCIFYDSRFERLI